MNHQNLFVSKKEGTLSTEEVLRTFEDAEDLQTIKSAVEKAKDRIYVTWASVEGIDKANEVIPIEDIIKDQETLLKRNGPISDDHTNRIVGQTIAFKVMQHPKTGTTGVLHLNKIHSDNDIDDQVWQEIQSGKRMGASVGGYNTGERAVKDTDTGQMATMLTGFRQFETATTANPCNPWALNEAVSVVAKSNASIKKPFAGYTDFEDCVRQNKDKDDPKAYCATIISQVEGDFTEKQENVKKHLAKISDKLIKIVGDPMDVEKTLQTISDNVKALGELPSKVDKQGELIETIGKRVDAVEQKFKAEEEKPEDEMPPKKEDEEKEYKKKEDASSDVAGEKGKEKPESPDPEDSNEEDVFKAITALNKRFDVLEQKFKPAFKVDTPRPDSQSVKTTAVNKALEELNGMANKIATGMIKKNSKEVHRLVEKAGISPSIRKPVVKARHQFETIGELLEAHYGPSAVQKDAPVLTSTTGYYNAIFGAMAFGQLNNEANIFAALPKYPWQHSGFRALTADAGSTADGGIAENGTIPATVKPTLAEITVSVKQVAHSFDVSFVHEGLVNKDDAVGDMEFLRGYFATLHAKRINEQLAVDADTLASNSFESIDRVTISTAAVTTLSYTAGDEDIHGVDRSANSWADAYVSHNSGTDRVLTDNIITSALASLRTNGARTNLIITGNDTYAKIMGIYQDQVRYMGLLKKEEMVRIGVNGVQTEEGIGVGIRVATLYGIPVITSQAIQQDTISRIYLLDTTEQEGTGVPRLGISLLYPTMYFESGMSASPADPFAVNRFGTEGVYYTAGELVCTFFAAQGSIRDLQ